MKTIAAVMATIATTAVALAGCDQHPTSSTPPTAASAPVSAAALAPAPASKAISTTTEKIKPSDGPFGVRMGMTTEELGKFIKLKSDGDLRYDSDSAPIPHKLFSDYIYRIGNNGLCSVKALSKTIESNSFGDGVKDAFSEISQPLVAKYGKPTFDHDFIRSGSIWDKQEDWMMGLYKEERVLNIAWVSSKNKGSEKTKNPVNLPSDIAYIELEARAYKYNKAFLVLDYLFMNNDDCVNQIKKNQNKGL
ncbi:MAG: hypothetical protein LBH10_01300 [Burkholderiaceae bacterium]|jgi:hypothetical protein|nr:hypothetical protein [Burkholderiaceae bacterium]